MTPQWLTDPALEPVWRGLREPLERGAARARLPELPRSARHALAGLLGRPVVAAVPVVELAELSTDLTRRTGLSLPEVVASLTGPLRDLRSERTAALSRRSEPLELLTALSAGLDRPWLPQWLAAVRTAGTLTREPEWERVVRAAVQVLEVVLSGGAARSRTELAASCAGDAHALDAGAPVGALVLRALALEVGEPWPTSAEARRALWELAGVLPDLVSQTVLTLGLRGGPAHLTAWDLRREPVRVAGGTPVLVCENPAVLEAFAVAGTDAVVVCGSGSPSVLCLQVLDALSACGALLHYHGDFDWPGVEICNRLVARCGVRPWRMSAADYLSVARPGGLPLSGRRAEAGWDARLGPAMERTGVAVHEEQVLADLVRAWSSARCAPP